MANPPYADRRDAAIGWLMGRINYERTSDIPYAEKAFKLEPVRRVLRELGDPHKRLRIVHLAGTKGKGSTGAMIAAALGEAGLSVGFSTSPHLERLEERFAVDGEPCTAEELADLVDRVRPIAEAMDREEASGPTFFDLTTAMALEHFARRGVDAVVLEVGLGGRLDSTNVVTPAVSVVTSISLDHTKQLGPTRAHIAAEKAGILKPGVPAVSGVMDAEAGHVIHAIAGEKRCPFWRRGKDFDLTANPKTGQLTFTRIAKDRSRETIPGITPALPGAAQAANAAVALATLGVLADAGWDLPIEARRRGVATGRLPARLEVFPGEPTVVVDGAHNDASAAALAEVLDELCGAPRERRVLVVAISDDKDTAAILEPLARRFAAIVATRYLDNPRSQQPTEVAEIAGGLGSLSRVSTAPTPKAAYAAAKEIAGPDGAVVFAGSLLFAAEARRLIVSESTERCGVR